MARSVKQVRTLHERLKIIEEVEKNPSEKRIDIAKRLGLAPSTLNSIVAKKKEIQEQIHKCGDASKIRKTGKESNFIELESVLFAWYQQALASNIPINGTILREKAKTIAVKLNIGNFTASNGWITRFKERRGIVRKKLTDESIALDNESMAQLMDSYKPWDIYAAGETGLFYNVLPLTFKDESYHYGKSVKNRITVMLCVNSDGSDKRMPIVIGKTLEPRCFKNIKKLPVKYYANRKAWMTVDIFTIFLRSLDDFMNSQNRNILLIVDNCAAHPQNTTFLRNVRVVHYPANCTSVCQPLGLGIINSFKHYYRKRLVQTAACLMDTGNNVNVNINVLEVVYFIVAAWRQVAKTTVTNCFSKGGYGFAYHEETDYNITEDEKADEGAFYDDWTRFSAGKDLAAFRDYVLVDSELATCGVDTIEDQFCDDREGCDSSEEGEDECELEAVPCFAEAHAALVSVKSFFHAHSISERDEDNISSVERTLFDLKCKVSTKQLSIKDFCVKLNKFQK